jgi:hypothetical protein
VQTDGGPFLICHPLQDSAADVKGQEIISQEVLAFVRRGVSIKVGVQWWWPCLRHN